VAAKEKIESGAPSASIRLVEDQAQLFLDEWLSLRADAHERSSHAEDRSKGVIFRRVAKRVAKELDA
jgi:hypothetical protein